MKKRVPTLRNEKELKSWADTLVRQLNTPQELPVTLLRVFQADAMPAPLPIAQVVLVFDDPDYLPAFSDGATWRYFDGSEV